MKLEINKQQLWRAHAVLERKLYSIGVTEIRLSNDIAEFDAAIGQTDKDGIGEHFRRSINILPPNRFLWLGAHDEADNIIGIVAARYDDFEGWTLQNFVKEFWERSYRTKTGKPVKMALGTSAYAIDISGPVVYMGDGFVAEAWRNKGVASSLVKMLTFLAWDEWKPKIIYGWMRDHHVRSGMNAGWGFTDACEAAFDFIDPPEADYHSDAWFVAARKVHIYQSVFSLLRADRRATENSNNDT